LSIERLLTPRSSSGLNNSTVLDAIGFSAGPTIYHNLLNTAIGNLVLVCAGSLPGYWLSVFTIDTLGRKSIQLFGFILLTVIFCIIGFAYESLSSRSLLVLYILAQFFFNFGPNTTTFIIPGECFPTRYRSTGHGFSAAAGKVGAIIAQVMAQPLLTKGAQRNCKGSDCSPWLDRLMQIFALFMLCGTLVSLLVPETKGRTLEELAGEGPTSLNRKPSNGDLKDGSKWWRKWNPLTGGKPAGWSWNRDSPNLGPRSPGLRGKRERIGIMTSPELIPKQGEKRNGSRFWKWGGIGKGKEKEESRTHARAFSETSGSGEAYSVSVSSHGRHRETDDDLYITGSGAPLPGWGAGWAVQRNPRRDDRVESIMLQDVGSLLK
jgi:MFS transporter, PHS family, inorganic phosphate transporter